MTTDQSIQNLQPRSSLLTWIGVVLLFAFFGLLVLVIIGASPRGTAYEKKRAKARYEKLQSLRDETTAALTTYGWVDKTKGVARIPINDAMKITMAELAQKKPAPANPIALEAQTPAGQTGAPLTATPPATSPVPSGTGTPKPTTVTGPNSESRGQPAAADNPPGALPGTQPGPSASPPASAGSAAARPPQSPTAKPSPPAAGSPLPVRGKTP